MRVELPADPKDLTPELVIAMFGDPRRVAEIVFGDMDQWNECPPDELLRGDDDTTCKAVHHASYQTRNR